MVLQCVDDFVCLMLILLLPQHKLTFVMSENQPLGVADDACTCA